MVERVCAVSWASNQSAEKSTAMMPATLPEESRTGL
jgi:hypothetical protein